MKIFCLSEIQIWLGVLYLIWQSQMRRKEYQMASRQLNLGNDIKKLFKLNSASEIIHVRSNKIYKFQNKFTAQRTIFSRVLMYQEKTTQILPLQIRISVCHCCRLDYCLANIQITISFEPGLEQLTHFVRCRLCAGDRFQG